MSRIAVIGLGRWGQRLIGKLNEGKIVSVLVTDPTKHSSPWPLVSNFAALAEAQPSHVFVLSPIPYLREHAIQALGLGANVFVEKPFTYCPSILSDITTLLLQNSEQKLHVNHLFQYSALLDELKGAAPSRLVLRWHKHSVSAFSIEENLLSHAVTILLVLFGPTAPIELRDKSVSPSSLQLYLRIAGIEAFIIISVSRELHTTQVMSLTYEWPDSIQEVDLLKDPADKLQCSLDAFFKGPELRRMENFNLHCSIARVMRSVIGEVAAEI